MDQRIMLAPEPPAGPLEGFVVRSAFSFAAPRVPTPRCSCANIRASVASRICAHNSCQCTVTPSSW